MARQPNERTRPKREKVLSPDRVDHFSWGPDDITISYPDTTGAASQLSDELHTILWSLEHVSNQATFDQVMVNVAHYLTDHPGDALVAAALQRVEQRLEHAT